MGKAVQLSIPKACHEDWHNMTFVEKGRHCMFCNKTVVDFTNRSDREILHHIANAGGSRVCGRLNPDQMHRSITMQKKSRSAWLKYFFQFTLPAFLMSMKAEGQEKRTVDTVQVQSAPVEGRGLSSHKPDVTMRGRVVFEDGEGVPFATVEVKGDSATMTDKDGYFSVNWPKEKKLVLFVSCVGCKPLRKKIKEKFRNEHVVLELKMSPSVLGEVIITY